MSRATFSIDHHNHGPWNFPMDSNRKTAVLMYIVVFPTSCRYSADQIVEHTRDLIVSDETANCVSWTVLNSIGTHAEAPGPRVWNRLVSICDDVLHNGCCNTWKNQPILLLPRLIAMVQSSSCPTKWFELGDSLLFWENSTVPTGQMKTETSMKPFRRNNCSRILTVVSGSTSQNTVIGSGRTAPLVTMREGVTYTNMCYQVLNTFSFFAQDSTTTTTYSRFIKRNAPQCA